MFEKTDRPTLAGSSVAPITATPRGRKKQSRPRRRIAGCVICSAINWESADGIAAPKHSQFTPQSSRNCRQRAGRNGKAGNQQRRYCFADSWRKAAGGRRYPDGRCLQVEVLLLFAQCLRLFAESNAQIAAHHSSNQFEPTVTHVLMLYTFEPARWVSERTPPESGVTSARAISP
jgi:hypothetical protein